MSIPLDDAISLVITNPDSNKKLYSQAIIAAHVYYTQ